MTNPTVSLIIVSRHRKSSLQRTIAAVQLQDYQLLELIVVADPEAAIAVRAMKLPIKVVEFDRANISGARNAGLAEAAGALVAFLDDDAVPEPTWIARLTAPFVNADVRVATGFVRGRNGISDQWRAFDVDQFGWDHPLSVDRHSATLLAGSALRTVKALGANCAFRRDDLLALGGFDDGYKFYLDDADISLRLAKLGGLTAVVPMAVVQHDFSASVRRRTDRALLSLEDIGASSAYFVRRHAADAKIYEQHVAHRHAQERRVVRQLNSGALEPRDVGPLLATFDQGWAKGVVQQPQPMPPLLPTLLSFLPLGTGPRQGLLITGRIWQKRELMRRAGVEATIGKVVTVICLSPSTWYHRHSFESGGFWMQKGGIFGKAARDRSLIRLAGFAGRVKEETARIGATRPLS